MYVYIHFHGQTRSKNIHSRCSAECTLTLSPIQNSTSNGIKAAALMAASVEKAAVYPTLAENGKA
jgi:hypothetical protein